MSSVRRVWKIVWSLDTLVLLSLFLQFALIFTAPLRKHSLRQVIPFMWLSYLLALYYANYSMGLIPDKTVQGGRTGELRCFWAPFLILHLGGPNTITALSLVDNELWLRYAVHIGNISYTFLRLFFHSLVNNDLRWPTGIMLVAGLIKSMERLICLFSARLTKFRDSTLPTPDPGVNYTKLMETYSSLKESNFPVKFEKSSAVTDHQLSQPSSYSGHVSKLSQVQIVKDAYRFFHDFRGLFVNSVYSYHQRSKSMEYFRSRNAEDAFSICEVELNFAYDVFYTKAILINMTKWPYLNVVSFFLQLVSFVLWSRIDKHGFKGSSIKVTYALLTGSIALELLSLFMFVTSNWNIARVKQEKVGKSVFSCFCEMKLSLGNCARENLRKWRKNCISAMYKMCFCRWSECIAQLNLLSVSLDKNLEAIVIMCRNGAGLRFPHRWFTNDLRNFIFEELVTRSKRAQHPKDVEELCYARGFWILTLLSSEYEVKGFKADTLRPWITDVDLEESLILWHVATKLCYTLEADDHKTDHHCRLSKIISDYVLHLLILEPRMMPTSTRILGRMIFLDTCAEAKRFFDRVFPLSARSKLKSKRLQMACEKIIQVNTKVVAPRQIKGEDKSKSVLFDACVLAKELQGLKKKQINMWEIISKVWAEMLFYCAAHCSPSVHVEKLSIGGELLTLVWLLMTHLGLGKQFRYKKRRDRTAEMVVNW